MKLLALCFLLPVVYGVAVEECAWGESYWCSELSIAKTCGAVQHCTTTVWKNQQIKSSETEVCEFCQSIVDDVHKFIASKKTEDEITHYLVTACAIIPDTTIADECKMIVQQFTPEIMDLILSGVSPKMICGLLHLCTGVKDTVKHASVVIPSVQPTTESAVASKEPKICTDCEAFIGDIVQQFVSNATVSEIESLIDQEVCSQLGTYRDMCNQIVKEFLPEVMDYVQQALDPKVLCQSMGYCTQTSDRARVIFNFIKSSPLMDSLTKVGSSETCLLCKTAISEVRVMIRNKAIQSDIEDFLINDICTKMGTYKDGCTAVIGQFAGEAFEFLATVLDPETRCRGLRLCPAVADASGASVIVRQGTPTVVSSVSAPSAECVVCEFVMKEVLTLIKNNRTETEIMAALEKVCSLFPSSVKQSCVDFVDTYGRAILSLLETQVSADEVCTILGLCKTRSTQKVEYEVKVDDPQTCLICETVVQYVETLVTENATVQEIDDALKKVCNFLPDTMKTQCDNLVNEYSKLIIQYIVAQYDPKEICILIKLCDGTVAVRAVNLVSATNPRLSIATNCSQGPKYWCATQWNANECGAVEHCKKYVWKN